MTLEEQYSQRKVVLDAVAVEVRRMVDMTTEAGLETSTKQITFPGPECEWHIQIQVNVAQYFVVVAGHRHLDDPEPQPLESEGILSFLMGGGIRQDPMAFNFNCPIDWVPKAEL